MTEKRNILISGATGNVGRHLVADLLDAGVAVRALVRAPDLASLPPEVELVRGHLTDPDSVATAADGADAARHPGGLSVGDVGGRRCLG